MLDYDYTWVVYIYIRNELFNLGLSYIWNEKVLRNMLLKLNY